MIKQFHKPEQFKNILYCYYIYQEIIEPEVITPQIFVKYVQGGSLTLKYIDQYNTWLGTVDGKKCKKLVGNSFEIISDNYIEKNSKTDSNKIEYGVFLNLLAIKQDGKSPQQIYNHELLHVAFAQHIEHRHRILKSWDGLSDENQTEFKSKHSGYKFTNKKLLMKEYFSYTFQHNVKKGLRFLLD